MFNSYSLGITGKLSGLVSSFTETERELVAVERVNQGGLLEPYTIARLY